MELISKLFCLKGNIQKENFNEHPRQASKPLFDVMVSFVFCLGPGYFLKPCARCRDN